MQIEVSSAAVPLLEHLQSFSCRCACENYHSAVRQVPTTTSRDCSRGRKLPIEKSTTLGILSVCQELHGFWEAQIVCLHQLWRVSQRITRVKVRSLRESTRSFTPCHILPGLKYYACIQSDGFLSHKDANIFLKAFFSCPIQHRAASESRISEPQHTHRLDISVSSSSRLRTSPSRAPPLPLSDAFIRERDFTSLVETDWVVQR